MTQKEDVSASISRAQAELERALGDLSKLPVLDPSTVAFTAHALNNYLTVTGGTIELLQRHLAIDSDPQVRTWLDGLSHVTDLMAHSVSQLMSTAATTESKLRFERADLALMLTRVCMFYRRVAADKQLTVLYNPPRNVPPVWADRVAVAAVLDNLLSNAVKYSPLGKRIWVKLVSEPPHVVCHVIDEGPGLSKEDQSKLFQRGVRLSSVPTGGEPTSGYGLAVAKELITRLGGEIWCVSELGNGACFSFRLPSQESPAPQPGA